MWLIDFYTTDSGKSPVLEFLDQLPLSPRAKVRNVLRLLQQFGPQLRQPYSKKLTGSKYLFLHAFIKKSAKTPIKNINIALNRIGA